MDLQPAFAAALLDPAHPGPPGLRAWNGSDPRRRLDVYRNNVLSSLTDALADTFPVVQQLVGQAFFRAMAAVFVREAPPRSPVLAHYGAGFAEFVERFGPAASVPYLADVARLEHARLQALHAADAPPLDAEAAASAAAIDPARTHELRPGWHPSVRLLRLRHAAVSLWAAHQHADADGTCGADDPALGERLASIDPATPEAALVLRPALEVLVVPLAPGEAAFVAATLEGAALGAAVAAAADGDPGFDFAATLGRLVAHGALSALTLPDAAPRSPTVDGGPRDERA